MKASKKLTGRKNDRHFVYNLSLSYFEMFRLRDALREVIIKDEKLVEHSQQFGTCLPCVANELKDFEHLFSTIDTILFL